MDKPPTDRSKFAAFLIATLFYLYCFMNSFLNNDVAARGVLFICGSIVFPYSIFNIYPTIHRVIAYIRKRSTTAPVDTLVIYGDFAELFSGAFLLAAVISQFSWNEISPNRRGILTFWLSVNLILQAGTWGYKKISGHI